MVDFGYQPCCAINYCTAVLCPLIGRNAITAISQSTDAMADLTKTDIVALELSFA